MKNVFNRRSKRLSKSYGGSPGDVINDGDGGISDMDKLRQQLAQFDENGSTSVQLPIPTHSSPEHALPQAKNPYLSQMTAQEQAAAKEKQKHRFSVRLKSFFGGGGSTSPHGSKTPNAGSPVPGSPLSAMLARESRDRSRSNPVTPIGSTPSTPSSSRPMSPRGEYRERTGTVFGSSTLAEAMCVDPDDPDAVAEDSDDDTNLTSPDQITVTPAGGQNALNAQLLGGLGAAFSLSAAAHATSAKRHDTSFTRRSHSVAHHEMAHRHMSNMKLMKDLYAQKPSGEVVAAEKKRLTAMGTFSPLLILQSYQREQKLDKKYLEVTHYFTKKKTIVEKIIA